MPFFSGYHLFFIVYPPPPSRRDDARCGRKNRVSTKRLVQAFSFTPGDWLCARLVDASRDRVPAYELLRFLRRPTPSSSSSPGST